MSCSSVEPSAVEVREAQRTEAGMGPSSDVQQDFQVSETSRKDSAGCPSRRLSTSSACGRWPAIYATCACRQWRIYGM